MKKIVLIISLLFVTLITTGQQKDGEDVVIGKYRTID